MPEASIQLWAQPHNIGAEPITITWYHLYIVINWENGERYILRAGPSLDPANQSYPELLADLIDEGEVSSGTIVTHYAPYNESPDFDVEGDDSFQNIITGTDEYISQLVAEMQAEATRIDSASYEYNFVHRNSNTAAWRMLEEAGLRPVLPLDREGDTVWAPGAMEDFDVEINTTHLLGDFLESFYENVLGPNEIFLSTTLRLANISPIKWIDTIADDANTSSEAVIDNIGFVTLVQLFDRYPLSAVAASFGMRPENFLSIQSAELLTHTGIDNVPYLVYQPGQNLRRLDGSEVDLGQYLLELQFIPENERPHPLQIPLNFFIYALGGDVQANPQAVDAYLNSQDLIAFTGIDGDTYLVYEAGKTISNPMTQQTVFLDDLFRTVVQLLASEGFTRHEFRTGQGDLLLNDIDGEGILLWDGDVLEGDAVETETPRTWLLTTATGTVYHVTQEDGLYRNPNFVITRPGNSTDRIVIWNYSNDGSLGLPLFARSSPGFGGLLRTPTPEPTPESGAPIDIEAVCIALTPPEQCVDGTEQINIMEEDPFEIIILPDQRVSLLNVPNIYNNYGTGRLYRNGEYISGNAQLTPYITTDVNGRNSYPVHFLQISESNGYYLVLYEVTEADPIAPPQRAPFVLFILPQEEYENPETVLVDSRTSTHFLIKGFRNGDFGIFIDQQQNYLPDPRTYTIAMMGHYPLRLPEERRPIHYSAAFDPIGALVTAAFLTRVGARIAKVWKKRRYQADIAL